MTARIVNHFWFESERLEVLICWRALLQEFVEATKENSGLDLGNLNEQPGNRSKQALGEIQTPKGDVSGEYPHGLTPQYCSCYKPKLPKGFRGCSSP